MKQQYEIKLRLSEDLLRRLLYLCEAENRTPSAEVSFLLRNNAAYFEKTKGRMNPAKLAGYDLSPYRTDTGTERGE